MCVWRVGWCIECVMRVPGGGLEGIYEVKIGQFMSRSIQSVHVKDLSFENLASSSLQFGVVKWYYLHY